MAGKVFDGVISFLEEMKVIKTLFSSETLELGKKRSQQILSQNNSVKIQGMKK